jgi:acyl-CoA synthetase (AMP-forming)/AMP-acid ligase II
MRPEPEVRTLAELCLLRGRTHAARPAVADDEGVLTYAEHAERAAAAARRLAAHGVGPGTQVALQGRNSTRWVVAAFGALISGAALVPIGHGASAAERAGVLDGLGPVVLVHDEDLPTAEGVVCLDLPGLTEPEPGARGEISPADPGGVVSEGAPALVLSSSGTTGAVKSVPMSHGQLLRMYGEVGATMRIHETDRILVAVPLAHSFGFNGLLLVAMIAGAMVRVLPAYDRSVVAAVARDDALTVLAGPPTIYHDLADSGPLPNARTAIAGGQVVPVAELVEVARSLGVAEVVVGYGMTETCGTVALATIPVGGPEQVARMAPISGVEVVVRDELDRSVTGQAGRILVRGYNLARPYGAAPDLLPGGWFDTGDLGTLDADGRLTVVGRRSDMVIVSGFNVHPRDVETVLAAHPEVAQVAVTGIPDRRRGQRLVACVVPRRASLDLDLVDEFARTRLSAYKLPAAYVVVNELPVTSTGKLARTALREIAERELTPR